MKKHSKSIKCNKCGKHYEDFRPVPMMLCPQCYTKAIEEESNKVELCNITLNHTYERSIEILRRELYKCSIYGKSRGIFDGENSDCSRCNDKDICEAVMTLTLIGRNDETYIKHKTEE